MARPPPAPGSGRACGGDRAEQPGCCAEMLRWNLPVAADCRQTPIRPSTVMGWCAPEACAVLQISASRASLWRSSSSIRALRQQPGFKPGAGFGIQITVEITHQTAAAG